MGRFFLGFLIFVIFQVKAASLVEIGGNVEVVCVSETEYALKVKITSGEVVSATSFVVTGTGAFLTWTKDNSIWCSSGIPEIDIVDLKVINENGGEDLIFISLYKQCSCPVYGKISGITSNQICEEGEVTSSEVNIEYGGSVGPYSVHLILDGDKTNPLQSTENLGGGINGGTHTFTGLDKVGVYTVRVEDSQCQGAVVGVEEINYYQNPMVSIVEDDPVFCAGVDQASYKLIKGVGEPNWIVTVDEAGVLSEHTLTVGNSPLSLVAASEGKYSIVSVKDGNSCLAKGEDLLGQQIEILKVEPPSIPVVSPKVVGNYVFVGDSSIDLAVEELGSGYITTWQINAGQGRFDNATSSNTRLLGLNSFDPEANATTNISVTYEDFEGICSPSVYHFSIIRLEKLHEPGGDIQACFPRDFPIYIALPELIDGIEEGSLLQDAGGLASYNSNESMVVIPFLPEGVHTVEHEVSNVINGSTYYVTEITVYEEPCLPLGIEGSYTEKEFYPNPASQVIHLKGKDNVKIFSVEGILKLDSKDSEEVNIESLKSGLYILRIEKEGQLYSSKLIVE